MSFCQDIYDMLCKKYPNSNIYLISDHHFCHNNIINYTRTEFNDISSMHSRIISEHNNTIGEDDIVIFLGDFSFKNSFIREVAPKLNGHKFLIMGNHDQSGLFKSYPILGFEGVYVNPIRLDGNYLSHEPLISGERDDAQFKLIVKEFSKCSDAMNYHGHIHTEDRLDSSRFTNVTCEALNYKPLLIGRTYSIESCDKELFINSKYFHQELDRISHTHNLNSRVVLKDYIYASILDAVSDLYREFFIQGSFGLYKKYGFVSDFSDIDISYIYNPNRSKKVNVTHMKTLIDDIYESLKGIDNINLSFVKRYASLRIFEAMYTSQNPYCVRCYVDSNLVFLDSYRDTDFYTCSGRSTLEELLLKDREDLCDEFVFPEFNTQVIIPEADAANLILQILFQKDLRDKKTLILRKLQHIYKVYYKQFDQKKFEDIFTRFFLRNICLLHALHRFDEISHIQITMDEFSSLIDILPPNIKPVIDRMLINKDSIFMDVYSDIASVNPVDTLEKSSSLMKKIK